jgi:hypothetical protein
MVPTSQLCGSEDTTACAGYGEVYQPNPNRSGRGQNLGAVRPWISGVGAHQYHSQGMRSCHGCLLGLYVWLASIMSHHAPLK